MEKIELLLDEPGLIWMGRRTLLLLLLELLLDDGSGVKTGPGTGVGAGAGACPLHFAQLHGAGAQHPLLGG